MPFPWLAAATIGSALLGHYQRNTQARHQSSLFHRRMSDAEQYGIHPLQAIGSAGTAAGQGGATPSADLGAIPSLAAKREAEAKNADPTYVGSDAWKRQNEIDDRDAAYAHQRYMQTAANSPFRRLLHDNNMRAPVALPWSNPVPGRESATHDLEDYTPINPNKNYGRYDNIRRMQSHAKHKHTHEGHRGS